MVVKEVDPQNGYRYYSAAQVQQLNALLELKALGFSLEEIKSVLDGDTTREGLLDALAKKRRAWFLVKMVCIEDVRAQKTLSEALWLKRKVFYSSFRVMASAVEERALT